MADYGSFQTEIYFAGLSGVVPDYPMDFAGWESRAAHALSPSVLSYVAGGAGDEGTQRANVTAFSRWGLMPRMFVGATKRDLSVELFGLTLLHHDRDFATVAGVTGQALRWYGPD